MSHAKPTPDAPVAPREISLDFARNYEENRFQKRPASRRIDEWEKKLVQQALDLVGNDSHVVDVPCGSGRFFSILSDVRRLTMIDLSESMLQACRERIGEDHPGATFIEADIRELPLEDGAADLILCMRLFHHLGTDELRSAALSELGRVAGRYVAVTFYNSKCLRYQRRKVMGRKFRGQYTTYGNLCRLAAAHGLEPLWRRPAALQIRQQTFILFKKA